MSEVFKWSMVGDLQIPYEDRRAVALYLKVMKAWKPHAIDFVGDIDDQLEYSTFSDGTTDEAFDELRSLEKQYEKITMEGLLEVARRKKPIKYYSPRRRAVYAQGDEINPLVLFEMHAWTCIICRKEINRHLRVPHYFAATIEHIIPLSAGGTHTWDNVAPAHWKCNMEKGSSLPDFNSSIMIA